ncbi:MAG: hypothetical protein EOO40_03820, partial [Deltaproteobacteria bacterium]
MGAWSYKTNAVSNRRDDTVRSCLMSDLRASSSDSPRDTQTGRARTLVLGSAVLFYALFILRTSFSALGTRYFVLFEDAMISMRYARNFQEGFGLTWNKGEGRVEGYTNLLWTLWMSLAHAIGLPESKVS